MRARGIRSLGAAVVALVAAGAAPGQAQAAKVSCDASFALGVQIQAEPQEANRMELHQDGLTLIVRDAGSKLTGGDGCTRVSPDEVRLEGREGSRVNINVDLGDLNDVLTARVSADRTHFGPNWPGFGVEVTPGPGDDQVLGSTGDERLHAGGAADGADLFRSGGGAGNDSVDYESRTSALRVSLDGQADDGETGEGDDIGPGIGVLAGSGDDRIAGSDSSEFLLAGPGDDVLQGGGGSDDLYPGTGRDVVSGGPGGDGVTLESVAGVEVTLDGLPNDGEAGETDNIGADVESLSGSAGPDRLIGSDGPNYLHGADGDDVVDGRGGSDDLKGGTGADRLFGDEGDDTFMTRETESNYHQPELASRWVDEVSCGPGNDFIWYRDAVDRFDSDCEAEWEINIGPPPPCVVVPDPVACKRQASLRREGPASVQERRGVVAVTVRCPSRRANRCAGTLALRSQRPTGTGGRPRAGRLLGRRRFAVRRRGQARVRVRLGRRALRSLRARGQVRAFAITSFRRQSGHQRTTRRDLTLKASSRRGGG